MFKVIDWNEAIETTWYDNNKKTVCDINEEYWNEINKHTFYTDPAYTGIYSDDDCMICSDAYDWVVPYKLLVDVYE